MIIRPWFFHAMLGVLVICYSPASPARGATAPEKEVTELEEQMDRMNSAFRKLRRQAGEAAKNESSLELVAIMKEVVAAALILTPAKAVDMPEEDREKFVAGYRKQLEKLAVALADLATAFKAGDNMEATKLIGDIREFQKSGHQEYKKPDRD